jgi:hypothetical protein
MAIIRRLSTTGVFCIIQSILGIVGLCDDGQQASCLRWREGKSGSASGETQLERLQHYTSYVIESV